MNTTPSMSVTDQFLALIASELAAIVGAYAIKYAGELEGLDEGMAELAATATTETIPGLIKLAIEQNKGEQECCLKIKRRGEIATLTLSSNGEELLLMKNNEMVTRNVKLTDLEEWEDAPEKPKEYWYIIDNGLILSHTDGGESWSGKFRKEIGNYFSTKEEAEKAVEKLKALKRLKDKGFRFTGWYISGDTTNTIRIYAEFPDVVLGPIAGRDLDLLFAGGEE